MSELATAYEERLSEVEDYISFLQILAEQAALGGLPKIQGAIHPITPSQQRIMYSGVYIHLYNLVESTITNCIEAVARAAGDMKWMPGDLSGHVRREWVRSLARTHVELVAEKRLDAVVRFSQQVIDSLPISNFTIEKGGGGNWDDEEIFFFFDKRLGFRLEISRETEIGIKKPLRDDKGPLKVVKSFRNDLAHGKISFSQCSENADVGQLIDLKDSISAYLREVVENVERYLEKHEYLELSKRPS